MMGATASRNPCTCSHSGRKLSLPSKRSSTVTTVPGCVCGKEPMLQRSINYEAPPHHPLASAHMPVVPYLEPGVSFPTQHSSRQHQLPRNWAGREGWLAVPHSPSRGCVDASNAPQPGVPCQTSLMNSSRWRKLYELSKSPCTTMTGL